ncbi:TRI25 ligase, partial [Polypterus senegalus]
MAEHEKSFTDLIHCIEEAHKKLTEKIREQEKREMEKVEGVMEQLEKEIEELKRREAELKELSETKDHLHFLQTLSSCCVVPADEDSLNLTITADFSFDELLKELSGLKKCLEKISQWDILPLTPSGTVSDHVVLKMAEAQLCGLQDEFTCSVCLDTLTDPVTIPCGHNFCLKCLTNYWDQSQVCSCPQCRHTFTTRPELNRNTLLNEVIKKFKRPRLGPPLSQNYASPGDVECDFCTGKKFRAVKSCLTCLASCCQTHLQLHYEVAAWKGHKLVDPDGNLKEKLCEKHQKSLEMFCKTDKMCICMMCGVTEHNGHEMVELETEREEKEKQLGVTLSDIKRRVEEREKTLKETRRMMEEMKMAVKREVEENEKSFTALIRCIEEAHRKLTERIREEEKKETGNAEQIMERTEKEIEELKRREAELTELSETKDHLQFLQVTVTPQSDQTEILDTEPMETYFTDNLADIDWDSIDDIVDVMQHFENKEEPSIPTWQDYNFEGLEEAAND